MTYNIKETIEQSSDHVVQIVTTSKPHNCVDFEREGYTEVDTFRFESGFVQLDDTTKIEITRILMSCEKGHDHGVYYQAPRQMDVWEAFFALGETPEDTGLLSELDKDK